MNPNQTQAPDNGDHRPQQVPVPVLPQKEVVTEHQINVLLALMHHFQSYLLIPQHYRSEEDLPPKLDGGAHASAVSAFSAVCGKIEELLAQKKRWTTRTSEAVYDNVIKIQKAQIHLSGEQAKAAAAIRQPSYCLKPDISPSGNMFRATWGTINGYGPTPQAALDDFNEAFHRTPQQTIERIQHLKEGGSWIDSVDYTKYDNPHKKPNDEA
jgi:hypothetical protein